MRAMILAAGFGTRLSELGLALPKPLFPVCNHALIRYSVSFLAASGITEIAVNLHHRGDLIRDELGDGAQLGVRLHYSNEEGEILGTGGGIKRLADWFGKHTVVVCNGKIVCDVDLGAALAQHRALGAEATMVVKPDPEAARWGAIGIDEPGHIRRFLGSGAPAEAVTEHMFTGVHLLEPGFIARLPDGPHCVVQEGYRPAFEAGLPLAGWLHEGYWFEHSTPARFLQGNLNLVQGPDPAIRLPGPLRGVDESAQLAADVSPAPSVLVGPGARVESGARLGPDVVIGPDAHVAAGCQLARCVVLAGARVETDVKDAVVAADGRITPIDLQAAGPHTGPALGKSQGGS